MIADIVGLDTQRVATTMEGSIEANRHFRARSWEALTDDGVRAEYPAASDSGAASDQAASDQEVLVRLDVADLLRELDEHLQRIIVWRSYEECTQREIGQRLGIGQVQVWRLLARAMEQLRNQLDDPSDLIGSGA